MSSSCRDQLDYYLTEYLSIPKSIPTWIIDAEASEQDNLFDLELVLSDTEELKNKIVNSKDKIESSWADYSSMLKKFTAEERKDEILLYDEFIVAKDFKKKLKSCHESLNIVDIAISRYKREKGKLRKIG